MNVWILQESDYDIYEPIGIFSSKEIAIEKLFQKYPNAVNITITHILNRADVSFSIYNVTDKCSIDYTFGIIPYTLDVL